MVIIDRSCCQHLFIIDIYQHEIIFSLQADMFKPLRCSPLTHLDLRSAHLEFIHKGKISIHDPSIISNLLKFIHKGGMDDH